MARRHRPWAPSRRWALAAAVAAALPASVFAADPAEEAPAAKGRLDWAGDSEASDRRIPSAAALRSLAEDKDEEERERVFFDGESEEEWQDDKCSGRQLVLKLVMCQCPVGLLDYLVAVCTFAWGKAIFSFISVLGKQEFAFPDSYIPALKAVCTMSTFLGLVVGLQMLLFRSVCFTWGESVVVNALTFICLMMVQGTCLVCYSCPVLRNNCITVLFVVGFVSAIDYAALQSNNPWQSPGMP